MRRLSKLMLILAAVVLPVGACGGSEQPPPDAPGASAPGSDLPAGEPDLAGASTPPPDQDVSQLDVCTILPTSDIEQVIGKLADKPSGSNEGGEASCVFAGSRPDPSTRVVTRHGVVIVVMERSNYELEKRLLTHQALAGLGDDAFVTEQDVPDNEDLYRVWIAKGGRALRVTGTKDQQDGVSALARTLLTKL